jgi:hypothetical protein
MSSIIRATTTSGLQVAPDNSGSLQFQTNGTTTAVTIDTSQNVGIGTTSPTAPLSFAASAGTAGNANKIRFYDTTGDGVYGIGISAAQLNYLTGGSAAHVFYDGGSTPVERMRIASGGTLTSQATYDNTAAGSTVVVTSAGLIRRTSSSLKYKKNVETLEQTIVDNAVNNLRPVWYRTKNADGDDKATWSHIGLIAEEVDLVEPRLVKYKTTEVTQDESGANFTTELETPVPEDVDYAKLSVILLAKVKQLEARIKTLEAK